jgi:hypothetical protein
MNEEASLHMRSGSRWLRGAMAALWVAAFAGMGCGDENPAAAGIGGPPTGGADLANRPIDATNSALVYAAANAAVGNAIASVFAQAAKKPAASPALAKGVSVTVNGRNSGRVSASGDYNASASDASMSVKMTFDNFSDDGRLFIGGPLDIVYRLPNANPAGLALSYKGRLSFSGDYKGSMDFDISVSGGKASGSFSSGGQTIRF